jgi:acyl-CoA synthetase (AMP-forming)/AMP-acid ligase II
MSSSARLLASLTAFADKDAILFGSRTLTFGELDRLSRRYAAGLASLGVRPGDRVAVFAESSPELVAALLGHYRLGAVHVPINTHYRAEEAGHILRDSGASVLLLTPGPETERVLSEIGPLPRLKDVIALGGAASAPGVQSFESLLADEPLPSDAPLPADGDAALLIYTSGTTGKSKGVELSFGALVANIEEVTRSWGFTAADRLALALPLFHVHGLCLGIHGGLLHGFTVLLSEKFEAARIVASFEKSEAGGATAFMGVPTMYVRLLEHLEAHPAGAAALRRARLFTSGSAPLPADDFRAFEARTGHAILERYGMSETLFTLSNPYAGERRPGTVGLPVPGYEVRIVDDTGHDVSGGELGEIVVRGNGMMTGYWGRPEETAASFRDGWFLTGDVARRDSDGYVTIVGRKSVDIIKSGGYKISAREIEDVLRRHPRVREVAVVGAEDRVWGQRIVAAVVLEPGADIAPDAVLEDLAGFARAHLADFKRPREVLLLPELPRNALGKIQKHLILKNRLIPRNP